MDENLVITIDRQYGSRGRVIGVELAKAMGVKCYDKELLSKATKEGGLCEGLLETHDEKPANSSLYSLVMDTCPLGYATSVYIDTPISRKISLVQLDATKKLAEEESYAIVERCSNYTLVDYPRLVSVFITGGGQDKIDHLKELYDASESKAKDIMTKTDRRRANYYGHYTNKKRGDARGYSLCTNSSSTGIDGAVHIIQEFAKVKQEYLNSLKAK